MKPCAVSGKILHQVLVFVVSCVTLLFRCQLPSLVRPNPSKVFSSFKILRCYHFYGFPHSLTALTAFIDSWAGPLNQNTIGQAVQSQKDWCHLMSGYPSASELGPYHFLSSTLRAYFGPEAWRAPSPGQPSWPSSPVPCSAAMYKQHWSLTWWQEGRIIFPYMTLRGLSSTYSTPDTLWLSLHSSLFINWAVYCLSPFPDRKQGQKLEVAQGIRSDTLAVGFNPGLHDCRVCLSLESSQTCEVDIVIPILQVWTLRCSTDE